MSASPPTLTKITDKYVIAVMRDDDGWRAIARAGWRNLYPSPVRGGDVWRRSKARAIRAAMDACLDDSRIDDCDRDVLFELEDMTPREPIPPRKVA